MTQKAPKITAFDLYDMLEVRCAPPAWALLPQVGDSTGHGGSRYADAVGMELWPSRGLALHGYEIKVSKADWKKELANPLKAEAVGRFCGFWWIVAPKDLIPVGDLPVAWGLLEPYRGSLRAVKSPQKMNAQGIDLNFLAALLRRVYENAPPIENVRRLCKESYRAGQDQQREERERLKKFEHSDHARLQEVVSTFETASGVKIESWNAGDIGAAVKAVMRGDDVRHTVKRMRDIASAMIERCDEILGPAPDAS